MENKTDIIIVGAGISGLYCAYMLKSQGFKVQILEASSQIGGRIKSLTNFCDLPIELGAEFIHGKNSTLFNFLEYLNLKPQRIRGENLIYFKESLHEEEEASEKFPELNKAFTFFDTQWEYEGEEISVQDYLENQAFYKNTKNILDAFGLEYGTSNNHLGMRSLAKNEALWTAGKNDYKIEGPLQDILKEFKEVIEEDLKLNSIVTDIIYENDQVQVKDARLNYYEAQKVVVTVPLSILKNNLIQFQPKLPLLKIEAIQKIGFGSGMKVFLLFRDHFWEEDIFEIYGGKDCQLYYNPWPGRKSAPAVLVGYIMAERAEYLAKLGNQSVEILVKELDQFFGDKIASKNFDKFYIMDWTKEQFIHGTYSFDSPFSEGKRMVLAQNLNNTLFFAGEATNYYGHSATLHGAMESAERVVEEITGGIA
ncbi:flavin monoamine oxidase family protein [Flexithrix dorotheae]|uniref:flavin monoamine oxidase family protein n=1 Tax=Flexithrix dorotheae TaxID=70993 RepID=UPI00037BBD9A|nr:NAD(P)/FAD-dependent oxidoreductase [Flexithrix dorotheae]